MTDDELFGHFRTEFINAVDRLDSRQKQLFCRLVRAIHSAGLDLYHIATKNQVRFGRKNRDSKEASSTAGYINVTMNAIKVDANSKWAGKPIDFIGRHSPENLNVELIGRIEEKLKDWNGVPGEFQPERDGWWPDEFQEGTSISGQENGLGTSESLSSHSLNTILYGPPGTGKTYATFRRCVEICGDQTEGQDKEVHARYAGLVKEGRVEFVTFHQSYGYEEFVEGLRPETGGGAGFELRPRDGVLKRIADRARRDLDRNYVLVIDEINRGNISKVFGEAITLIEEDKREGKKNEISVTLPHSEDEADEGSPKRFSLPRNLYILGTMNTADRSIALLDTALRRRFEFEELPPKPDLLKQTDGINLPKVLKAMNERLEWFFDHDHLIGHAWFMDAESKADVDRIMRHRIVPLLGEWFHDDWSKARVVLGNNNDFIERKKLSPPKGADDDTGEPRYRWFVKEQKTYTPEAYERLIDASDVKEEESE